MKVALFGGTGFVGTYITKELLKNNHNPHLLVRPGSEYKVFQPDKCKINIGDIRDLKTIEMLSCQQFGRCHNYSLAASFYCG